MTRPLYVSTTPVFRPASLLDGLFAAPRVGALRTLRMAAMQGRRTRVRSGPDVMTVFITDGLGGLWPMLVDLRVDFRA